MGSSQISCIGGREGFGRCGLDHSRIDPMGDLGEQLVLFNHIVGLIQGAGEHEFRRKCRAFAFKCIEIYRFRGVHHSANVALRFDGLSHIGSILVRL